MQTVLSIFLFVAAIAYVEWRLATVRRRQDEADREATEHFVTRQEWKKQNEQQQAQRQLEATQQSDRIASIEQRLFFSNQPATAPAQRQTDEKPQVFYFRWPDDDGSFADSQRQTRQTEDTYYEFRLVGDDEAEFRFVTLSNTQLSKANNASKKYIERACVFTAARSLVYTCVPGRATLQRGRWTVTQKARIDYL